MRDKEKWTNQTNKFYTEEMTTFVLFDVENNWCLIVFFPVFVHSNYIL